MLDELKKTFDFGAWADTRTDEVLEYGGKQIGKHQDGRITLTQEKFIRAATLSPIPKWRLATHQAVEVSEEPEDVMVISCILGSHGDACLLEMGDDLS